MKKIAVFFLSVFACLGGILFSACGEKVTLTVSDNSVTIYKNDETQPDFLEKEIFVSVNAQVDVIEGDCVRVTQPEKNRNGKYSFTIHTIDGETASDEAQVRVTSIDNPSQRELISVQVKTVATGVSTNTLKSQNLFVVKGDENGVLLSDTYFDFTPKTANVKDLDWTFENGEKTMTNDAGRAVAEIVDNRLKVYDGFNLAQVRVKATLVRDPSILPAFLTYDVLNGAVINSLSLRGNVLKDATKGNAVANLETKEQTLILNGAVQAEEFSFQLKRNESANGLSKLEGALVVNVQDEQDATGNLKLTPVFYKKDARGNKVSLQKEEYENFVRFKQDGAELNGRRMTYSFSVEARTDGATTTDIDTGEATLFFYLDVSYENYDYSVSTSDVPAEIVTSYKVIDVDLSNANGDVIDDAAVDVYSSYATGDGYKITTLLKESLNPNLANLRLDDNRFYLSLDASKQSAKFQELANMPDFDLKNVFVASVRGVELEFKRTGNTFIAELNSLTNGAEIFVRASDKLTSVLTLVKLDFVSQSDITVSSSVYMNLYKISGEEQFGMKWLTDDGSTSELSTRYFMSTVPGSNTNSLVFKLRIYGLNTISSATSMRRELTLAHTTDARFVFSDIAQVGRSNELETEQYVDVSFTVSLGTYNFENQIYFWFVHATGKKTAEVEIDAFVPLAEASIDTTNSSSASIYMEEKGVQSYYQQSEGGAVDQNANGNETIQKLVVEAGSLILLRTQYEHTTNVEFRAISLEDLSAYAGAEDIERLFQSKEDNFGLDVAVQNFAQFRDVVANYSLFFNIQTERLTLTNATFKGYVCAIFSGYDAEHQPLKLLRFFALESVFAVNYLVPAVSSKTLYTTETLSEADLDLATMEVEISARADGNAPSYFDLENFRILSSTLLQDETSNKNLVLFSCDEEGNAVYGTNDYYTISGVSVAGGRALRFVVTANSTKLLKSFSDTIVVEYSSKFNSSYSRNAAITIKIENVKRVEEVVWTNKVLSEVGQEPEIYLNLTSKNESERSATISTSIGPSDAYILTNSLSTTSVLELVRDFDNSGAISITQNKVGNVLNLKINPTNSGTSGYIYLLPKDMIKIHQGTSQILAYELDARGEEVATYIPLENLAKEYDDLVGVGEENDTDGKYVNYFYSGDKKVQNSAVILKIRITVADGSPNHATEEEGERLAIRIYSAAELRDIDTAKWYRIMNNIQLSNWKSFENFSGRIFGNTENITLNFVGAENEVFVKNNTGTLKNLIFAGNVVSTGTIIQNAVYSGFVADVNRGTLQNVSVDVLGAKPSVLTTNIEKGGHLAYVGGLVGLNMNTVSGSKTYGLSISTSNADYVGGLVGENAANVVNCGVEFYDFEEGTFNKISAFAGQIGGFVGVADENSRISGTYLYAYSLDDNPTSKSVFECGGSKFLFVAQVAGAGVRISESFAFAGTLNTTHAAVTGASLTMENCYFTYYSLGNITTSIYKNYNQFNTVASYTLTSDDLPSTSNAAGSANFQAAAKDLASIDAWEVENVDKSVNFGFMHLKNTRQTVAVSMDSLQIKTTDAEPYKSLFVADGKGILFFYDPVLEVDDTAEQSQLLRLNTLNFTELFDGITQEQQRSLILTTTSEDLLIGATSVQVLSTNTSISIVVHSKMDYSVTKTFTIAVINNLPQTTVKVGETPLVEDQIIMLQKGNNQQKVVYSLKNFIYLNGREYETNGGFYEVDFCFGATCENEDNKQNDFVSIGASNNSLTLTGLQKTDDIVDVTSFVRLQKNSGVEEEFASAVRFLKSNHFRISVFEGATSFEVEDEGVDLSGRLIDHMFAHLVTDNADDLLAFAVSYGEMTTEMSVPSDTIFTIDVDEKLSLVFQWTKEQRTEKEFAFTISVKIAEEKLHLVTEEYHGIQILLSPASQIGRPEFVKTVLLNVLPKDVNDVFMSAYQIEDRTIRNSRTYYLLSDKKVSTLTPGSDVILAVQVDPAFALMDKLQVVVDDAQNLSSSVSISRLSKGDFGFFVSNRNSRNMSNEMGIEVDLDEADLTSDGYYYFRIYVMSEFSTSDILKLTAKFLYKGESKRQESIPLKVDYVPTASVRVNGQSTYLMSKGSAATVTVTINLDEKLGDFTPELDDLYLQGHGSGISLTDWSRRETENSIVYTATLICYVNATLQNGSSRGVFYVAASVESIIDGKIVTRVARATICLVDFTLDADNIRLSQTGVQTDGYDVFHAYYNMPTDLIFNYPLIPEEYEYYDPFKPEEAEAVAKMTESRENFFRNGYYADPENAYYINYSYDAFTGNRYPLTLKEQLWLVRDDGVEYRIHNGSYWLEQPSFFNIDAFEAGGREVLRITGTSERGQQLMKLQTVVSYQGREFVYDYYFMVVVSRWSDEELPTQITTGKEFVDYLTNSLEADDYILMNDIVLDDYTPLDTDLVKSLDGNGYTIHINSWAQQEGNEFRYALFGTVAENTVLKNVRVNLYDGGQISVDVSSVENATSERITVQVAGFAIQNNGIIYNSEVVSFKSSYQKTNRATNGIVVKYTKGVGTDPINLTDNWRVDSTVVGFVINNAKSIVNCRVGGESFRYVENILGTTFISTQDLDVFTIEGQKNVSGFVGNNGANGYVSASFVDNVQINNPMQSSVSVTAGFAIKNENSIMGSFVEGKGRLAGEDLAEIKNLTNISATGVVAGFVYDNASLIKNCYSNIGIENEKLIPAFASGFVYINEETGFVNLCYSASPVNNSDINQLPFSGVAGGSAGTHSLNAGRIERSYFYNSTGLDTTDEGKFSTGATPVTDIIGVQEAIFYGFSFASDEKSYDGIWQATDTGITLVSANRIAFSNRIAVGNEIFYNKTLYDADTLLPIDISYGSENNPIIIRTAYDFAMATGEATSTVISAYREFYTDKEVFGTYRLVNNIDMSDINQNDDDNVQENVKLTTTTKTFSGILDGNGFAISNITLRKENDDTSRQDENFGLFAKLDGGVVMNIDLTVSSIYNLQANMVGTLAGTAIDSRILSISLSPMENATTTGISVQGKNIVGGVVGLVLGESNMFDITVTNIEIFSRYRDENKQIPLGETDFRELALEGYSLLEESNKISYAGAVAGYVDVFSNFLDTYVQYTPVFDISTFNIVNVHANTTVDIYGEIVGGLFGYVGKSTYVYDATLTLNANTNLDTPSYITSKNMFAGGLVGENYGGLFAVSAAYDDELQNRIEMAEHGYYTSSGATEFGQQTIFSRTEKDENFLRYHNDVKYIGGLVGYMGGGYVHIGYSKLNTISHNPNTIAIGGIIGLLGHDETTAYQLTSVEGSPYVNVFLKDVYSSGDIYIDAQKEDGTKTDGFVAGIVGALLLDDNLHGNPSIAMQNVLAENYLSTTTQNGTVCLVGDETKEVENKLYASKHFMLAGNVVGLDGTVIDNSVDYSSVVEDFAGNFLIVNSVNSTYNVFDNTYSSRTDSGADTVGGYRDIMIGSASQQIIQLRPFGFKSNWMPDIPTSEDIAGEFDTFDKVFDNYLSVLYDSILCTAHIGDNSSDSHMRTPAGVYVQNNKYFLENGWEARYWVHTQDEPFPHIQLVPVTDVYFWDDYNTDEIMRVMNAENGTSATIVLRGKVDENDEHSTVCKDIDLRTPSDTIYGEDINGDDKRNGRDIFTTIKNFSGRLISYSAYTHDESMGTVSSGHRIFANGYEGYNSTVDTNTLLGGKVGDDVGIILDKPMFAEFGTGGNAQIEGITFYLCAGRGSANIDYSLVQNPDLEGVSSQPATSISNALFRNVGITLNDNVKLTAKEFTPRADDDNSVSYATGLIVPVAYATTFNNIKITSRNATFEFTSGTTTQSNIYLGALVGYLRQNTSYINISLQGIKFEMQDKKGDTTDGALSVNYNVANFKNVFAGLYAGKIARGNVEGNAQLARVNIGLSTLKNVNIVVTGPTPSADQSLEGEVYVGGFAGEVVGVDDISFIGTTGTDSTNNMTIRQNIAAKELYAGLGFGRASSSTFSIDASAGSSISLSGGIYQVGNMICDSVSIGGLVGYISNNASLSGVSIKDFVVAHIDNVGATSVPTYKDEDGNSVFAKNSAPDALTPYVVKGAGNDAIGGLFGFVNGANVRLTGRFEEISGAIDVAVQKAGSSSLSVAISGIIGKTTGSVMTDMSANISIDISVSDKQVSSEASAITTTAYVGGIIGLLERVKADDDPIGSLPVAINTSKTVMQYIHNKQNVVSNIGEIFYGGAVGYVKGQLFKASDLDSAEGDISININNVIFGGALKVYGNNIKGGEVTVGGVVGGFELPSGSDDGSETEYNNNNVTINNALSYGDVFVIYGEDENTLAKYNFGGIVGTGAPILVEDCKSIMTNFNSRLTSGSLKTNYNVGAIAGNPNGMEFENNIYSSVVCLTYQVEDGNRDAPYGDKSNYMGYSNNGKYDGSTISSNILSYFEPAKSGTSGESGKSGHKLNPAHLTEEGDVPSVRDNTITKFHNIEWVSFTEDIELSNQLEQGGVSSFSNIALIGNGVRVTRVNGQAEEGKVDAPGLIGELSSGIVSGFVIDYKDFSFDFDATKSVPYAGAVGQVTGDAIIYAVGVEGNLSAGVSSSGKELNFSGISHLLVGMINECYVNLDFQHRAMGQFAGIAFWDEDTFIPASKVIKSSYSSGGVELLVSSDTQSVGLLTGYKKGIREFTDHKIVIVDCYSTMQVKENYTDNATSTATVIKLVDGTYNDRGSQVVNASYALTTRPDGTTGTEVPAFADADTMSMPYNSDNVSVYGNSLKFGSVNDYLNAGEDASAEPPSETLTPWYFTPFTNNGYAVHGFGFLKNVSTYTRFMTNGDNVSKKLGGEMETDNIDDGSSVVPVYEYEKVDYLTLLENWGDDKMETPQISSTEPAEPDTDEPAEPETPPTEDEEEPTPEDANSNARKWFLGIANVGKLKQMTGIFGASVIDKQYRFRIENDLAFKVAGFEFGKNLGKSGGDFVLDGDNHTIRVADEGKSSFFGDVVGKIENLRLNYSIKFVSDSGTRVGTLAKTVSVSDDVTSKKDVVTLLNITVEGNISGGEVEAIGGVVGQITSGCAVALNSLVTINPTADAAQIVGGIAGAISGDASVIYSSNAGQIVLENSAESDRSFAPIGPDGKPTSELKFTAIAGGIVGVADAGSTIDHCYNDNGVLSGFTKTFKANYSAGGIVGYVGSTSGEVETKLSNNVNTALVGAGNYSSDAYAYAGGIVGYSHTEKLTLTDNTNSGPVQAIGKMPSSLKGFNLGEEGLAGNGIHIVEDHEYTDAEGNILTEADLWKAILSIDSDIVIEPGDIIIYKSTGILSGDWRCIISKNAILLNEDKLTETDRNGWVKNLQECDYATWNVVGSGGEETTSKPTNNPDELCLDTGIIYNPYKSRKIYAFGIGYTRGATGDCSNNNTSDDNIKNDGCIGQVKDSQTITFDRNKILSNPASNKNFWGYFNLKSGATLNVSGWDSYGFPSRVYAVDEITRMYKFNEDLFSYNSNGEINLRRPSRTANEISRIWNNEIFDAFIQKTDIGVGAFGWEWLNPTYHLQSKINPNVNFQSIDNSLSSSSNEELEINWNNGLGFKNDSEEGDSFYNFADFMMPQKTEYAESASFKSYDELLKDNVAGMSGDGDDLSIDTQTASDQVRTARNKIEAIDDKTDHSNFDQRTIDGVDTAFVSSGRDLLMVTDPYTYKADVDLDTLKNMFYNDLFTSGWKTSTDTSGFMLQANGRQVQAKFEWVKEGRNNKALRISANLPEKYDELTLLYSTTRTVLGVKLGKKNIVFEGGVLKFDLRGLLSDTRLDALGENVRGAKFTSRAGDDDKVRMIYSVSDGRSDTITANELDDAVGETDQNPFRIGLFFEDKDGNVHTLSISRAEKKNGSLVVVPEVEGFATEDGNLLSATFITDAGDWATSFTKNDENGYFGVSIEEWLLVEGGGLSLKFETTTNAAEGEEVKLAPDKKTVTIEDFRTSNINNLLEDESSFFTTEDTTLTMDLTQLLTALSSERPSEGEIAFGANDIFSVKFDGLNLNWNINGSNSFAYGGTVLSLSIEGNTLKISATEAYNFEALISAIKLMDVYYNIPQANYTEGKGLDEFTKTIDIYSEGSAKIVLETDFVWVTEAGELNPSVEGGTGENIFGVKFYSKNINFVAKPKENTAKIKARGCNFGYQLETWNGSRNDLIIGDFVNVSSSFNTVADVTWENWDMSSGVTINFVYHITKTTLSGEDGIDFDSEDTLRIAGEYSGRSYDEENGQITEVGNIISVNLSRGEGDDSNAQVTVKKDSTAKRQSYDDNDPANYYYKYIRKYVGDVDDNFVETEFSYPIVVGDGIGTNTTDTNAYIYRVFDNGCIMVDYINSIKTTTYTGHKVTIEQIGVRVVRKADGTIKKYEDLVITWKIKEDGTITEHSETCERERNAEDANVSDLLSSLGIEAKYVATYLDNKTIRFAQYDNENPLYADVEGSVSKWISGEEQRTPAMHTDESYYVGASKYGSLNNGNVEVSSYEHKLSEKTSFVKASGRNFSLPTSAAEGVIYSYDFRFKQIYLPNGSLDIVDKTEEDPTTFVEFGENVFHLTKSDASLLSQVLLVSDINAMKALNGKKLTVFGAGYFWKYHSDDATSSIVGDVGVDVDISNLRVIVAAIGPVFGANGTGENVHFYGNVSNFGSDLTLFSDNIDQNSISNMTISSLDIEAGTTQQIKETSTKFTLKNIIVAGDGENGENGTMQTNMQGEDGGPGGDGGTIVLGKTSSPLFVRAGVSGHGGYGADGGNGYFDSTAQKIKPGGSAGKPGDTNAEGGKVERFKDEETLETETYTGGGTREVFVEQSAGCGGIKGFAVIDSNYTSDADGANSYNGNGMTKLSSFCREYGEMKNRFYYLSGSNTKNSRWANIYTHSRRNAVGNWFIDEYYKKTHETYWVFGGARVIADSAYLNNRYYEFNSYVQRGFDIWGWGREEIQRNWIDAMNKGFTIYHQFNEMTYVKDVRSINISARAQAVGNGDNVFHVSELNFAAWTDGRDINYGGAVEFPDGSGSYSNDDIAKEFGDGKVRPSTVEGHKWEATADFAGEKRTVYNDSEDRSGNWYGSFEDSSPDHLYNAWDSTKFVWDGIEKNWRVDGTDGTAYYFDEEFYEYLKINYLFSIEQDGKWRSIDWLQFSFTSGSKNYKDGFDQIIKISDSGRGLDITILNSMDDDGNRDFLYKRGHWSSGWSAYGTCFDEEDLEYHLVVGSAYGNAGLTVLERNSGDWCVFQFERSYLSSRDKYSWTFTCSERNNSNWYHRQFINGEKYS